jgi:class 3 adenylate cyclase
MRCSKCGSENPSGTRFCGECGGPFAVKCPKCGAENTAPFKFCRGCGTALASASTIRNENEPSAIRVNAETAPEAPDGERKTVTALFADIKGSTELMEDLDPEEARAIIDPALKLMIDAAHRYDGYVVQSTGDGIFALFGAPVAHEDHPQRALFAALRMQAEISRYSAKVVADGGTPIEARVGVNTGEVVVRTIATGQGHTEYTPIGHTTNLASRMQAVARSGSVVVSEASQKLVEGYFQLKSIGPTKVKGVTEPVNVFEVTGLGPLRTRMQRAVGRGLTKFVGRAREIEAMRNAAELARAGHGQIVAAMAEAGTGKSRLLFEFKATAQSGWLVLEAFSVSQGKATAYLPVIELLHLYFEIKPEDDARKRREKVNGKVLTLDRSLEDSLPYLFVLLGIVEGGDPFAQMDAQVRRRRTQDAVKRILLRESLNQPLMLIFEDLHWIDEETQAFLNLLADAIANAPVLLLVNYRPEYSHSWGSKTYYTQLRLDPLGKESADEMLSALLGDGVELGPLRLLIVEKTQGNPLFMEEIFQALIEDGSLQRNGSVKLVRPVEQLRLPPTVQGILAARIDHLPLEEKELLQTLAVIGTEFPLTLVGKVVQRSSDNIDSLLSRLQNSEFIYEQPAAAGDIEYRFKHALTHDVAYGSLLTERRKLLHERTAQSIEALYPERLEDHYNELAHHYLSSDNPAKAVEYLRLAGEQAVGRGLYALALASVEPALRLIERMPGEVRLRAELAVRLMEAMTVTALHGLASKERLDASERICQLSESLDDPVALFRGLLNMGYALNHRFEARRGAEIGRRCLKLAQEHLETDMHPAAYALLTQAHYRAGELVEAAATGSAEMAGFFSPDQDSAAGMVSVNLWAIAPLTLAWIKHAMGYADEGLKLGRLSLSRARELKQALALVSIMYSVGILHFHRNEPAAVRELVDAEIAIAEENGLRVWISNGRALRAWAMSKLGQAGEAVVELELADASEPTLLQVSKSMLLTQVYMEVGRATEAIATIDAELARIEEGGARLEEGELYRLKGEAILMSDSSATAEAENCIRQSIQIARRQSAKWWELRAAVSLARLLRHENRRDEARAMLAELYNWFTEGFDTADLKDAKALLEELSE